MLDECMEYLENRAARDSAFKYEVIVVSDGSKDRTVDVAHKYSERYTAEKVRVLDLVENRGKGGAVRLVCCHCDMIRSSPQRLNSLFFVLQGMQSARGRQLLFADADGATKFADLDKLEAELNRAVGTDWQKEVIVIGSRAHLQDEAIATRSFFRTILMHGFHLLVWTFAVRGIRDTQCGFKLLTRAAGAHLFAIMHVERWAFDVELLYLAQTFGIPIAEVAVNWTEIDGSKIVPIWSWLQMGRDLFLIWFRYSIGAWSLKTPKLHSQ